MMNYYAQGGETYGLRSLAQDLQDYGRGGDTMLAHINPQEAALLKRMGGSGTINPQTGLPEYFLKSITKPFKKVLSAADDVIFQPITGAIQDVVQGVAKATGPVGQIAATYFGGPVGAGIYAGLSGEDGFNFKRALASAAMAYGAQNLGEGLSQAGGGSSMSGGAPPVELGVPGTDVIGSEVGAGLSDPSAYNPYDPYGAANPAASAPAPEYNPYDPYGAANPAAASAPKPGLMDKIFDPSTYKNIGSDLSDKFTSIPDKLSNVGDGISKLLSGDPEALARFKASGVTMQNTALPIFVGYTGMAGIDEAEKMKLEADLANAKSQEEYDAIMARIEASKLRGIDAMRANPYQFAYGGSVDDEVGIDSLNFQRGNMDNGMFGGQLPAYAKGGQPRFLSGGGDGMSDDIKATINNKQPARLADGEFVIPADVVSHLGNGSSKAGAKQLYSMMDRVRSARTGNKKQGKQIKPANLMPA